MAQAPLLDFDDFVARKRGERAGGPEAGGHDYAYVSDRQTRAAFERVKPVDLAVASTVPHVQVACGATSCSATR